MENNNMLAKISLGINLVLVIAVIILFVKSPGSAGSDEDLDDSSRVHISSDGQLSVAYYNSDSLSSGSDFVLDLQTEIEKSNQRGQEKMNNKEREIQRWQQGWEKKMETGLLPREQEQYAAEAQQKQMEIAQFEQQLQMEVGMEQEQLMLTLYKRLQSYAKTFCEKNDIDMLVSFQMGQNVIYMNPEYEVTSQFVNHINKEYNKTFEGEDQNEATESEDQ